MSGETITPNMSLPVPAVGVTSGPQYATDVNNSFSIIDGHNHTSGSGVKITPSAMNINAALTFNSNPLTNLSTLGFVSQLVTPTNLGTLYESGVDLYYLDGNGNNIRITASGTVTGSAGTITGLPSGTASAAYLAGVFTFQALTNTAATIDAGSYILRNLTAGSYGLTLSPPNAMGADYTLTLPPLPTSTQANVGGAPLVSDTSGNITPANGFDYFLPAGLLLPFAGSSTPVGWLYADGSAVSRTTYARLFTAIGVLYGPGDGSTTFNLPNMSGNIPVGIGGTIGATLAATGGEATHVLTTAELASHTHGDSGHIHGISDPGHNHSFNTGAGSGGGSTATGTNNSTGSSGTAVNATGVSVNTGNANIQNTGSSAGHNNVQPYVAVNYIIKY